jgi:hypothetical protein
MTHSPLRDALLGQMGGSSVAAELNTLSELVNAEARRARRLTAWTVLVWSAWFTMLGLSIGLPMLQRALAGPPKPLPPNVASTAATQPAAPGTTVPPGTEYGFPPSVGGILVGTFFLVAFLALPPVGILLLILMVLARRSASMGQIRVSLASIDAQLRMLTVQRAGPPQA